MADTEVTYFSISFPKGLDIPTVFIYPENSTLTVGGLEELFGINLFNNVDDARGNNLQKLNHTNAPDTFTAENLETIFGVNNIAVISTDLLKTGDDDLGLHAVPDIVEIL